MGAYWKIPKKGETVSLGISYKEREKNRKTGERLPGPSITNHKKIVDSKRFDDTYLNNERHQGGLHDKGSVRKRRKRKGKGVYRA